MTEEDLHKNCERERWWIGISYYKERITDEKENRVQKAAEP